MTTIRYDVQTDDEPNLDAKTAGLKQRLRQRLGDWTIRGAEVRGMVAGCGGDAQHLERMPADDQRALLKQVRSKMATQQEAAEAAAGNFDATDDGAARARFEMRMRSIAQPAGPADNLRVHDVRYARTDPRTPAVTLDADDERVVRDMHLNSMGRR